VCHVGMLACGCSTPPSFCLPVSTCGGHC
jgi:hypothetical protein